MYSISMIRAICLLCRLAGSVVAYGVLKGYETGLVRLALAMLAMASDAFMAWSSRLMRFKGHLHYTAFVYKAVHLLGALVLVMVYHEVALARSSLPVNGAKVVAVNVFLYQLELEVVANAAYFLIPVSTNRLEMAISLVLPHLYERRAHGHEGIPRVTESVWRRDLWETARIH